jgi:uncharacterized protein YxjI
MANRENFIYLSIFILIGLAIVGLGFSLVGIAVDGQKARFDPGVCPNIDINQNNITDFELKKQLSISGEWHWTYSDPIGPYSIKLQQVCYSIEHDVIMSINGHVSLTTDGKILSTTSKIYVNDCNGDHVYTITTGSFWLSLLNTNRIEVSFQLQDRFGQTLMYVAGTDYFSIMSKYSFVDINGTELASVEKDITIFPWTWKFHIRQPNSPVLDLRVLALVAAHSSFSEGGTDSNGSHVDTTDICNNYIFWTAIIVGITGFVYIAIIVFILWDSIKSCFARLRPHDNNLRRPISNPDSQEIHNCHVNISDQNPFFL